MPDPRPSPENLETEAALLASYLLARLSAAPGRVPGSELAAAAARYAGACGRLFTEPAPRGDAALMRFACRNPRTLPCLDAASGLLLPRTLLRQKLILMLAILETMPGLAEAFLPAARPRRQVIAGLLLTGGGVALKTLGGAALLPLARWSR